MNLSIRHLLGLEGVPRDDISTILDTAFSFREVLERPIKRVPTLQGKTIVNLFFENSTRTRISFELAEKRLSADTVNFSSSGSSLAKGESLKDTVRNLYAMKTDAVVMRHGVPGSAKLLTQFIDAVVINAGDGTHEHPTQALLDIMSLQEKFGSLDGLNIAIIGDIRHSRVALSNIYGLLTMGANVALCGPPTFMPVGIESLGVKVIYDLDEALAFADAINILRIQRERQGKGMIPSLREYRAVFGITRERLDKLHKTITILHPGPINRGVEIDSDVADSEHSLILHQVLNGVAVRMAVLFLLLGGK
ncbi:MAG: aspartate carbamoyltransferase catalytic subunit [Candidatus Marinimicrobia bacterium]|jgi:aspartate carbamoyltransferase catalytic subunit|nr:aspartate carbamoyltransferase catalytic subunit [Candidatus Neomarinimicrobiota bacterium]HNZ36559.1 aspartate carbamoyltransferase catalytic subunit [Candidatus Neomarinimicrobiota bacterium]HOV23059.1 aspartate carbamoyltransferase catalytic subunit [Candidatus Neomarinimicrobiota bacterium]HPI27693.1 aspartate carbamoyltransferase catalytic subunit [Candidatus Neomarinimicrobiota bacterium]HRD18598.1 aspartate carbamoyltransferase catalytic subunit [Candidatus Neomarinimicrobiota bacteri